MADGVALAGDVEFVSFKIYDPKRNFSYNLLGSFVQVSLYEDLFSASLHGEVTIVDTNNLINETQIIGEEFLELEFKTPTFSKSIKGTFAVNGIRDRYFTEKKNTWILSFISLDSIINITTRFSRAFSGTPTDIITNIHSSFMSKYELNADKSLNNIKFVANNWTPFKTISYAGDRAISPNKDMVTPDFIFCQTNSQYLFKSISNLVIAPSFYSYSADKRKSRADAGDGTSVPDIERQYKTPIQVDFVKYKNHIDNIEYGVYLNTVQSIDLTQKRILSNKYDIAKDFKKHGHLDKYPMVTDKLLKTEQTGPLLYVPKANFTHTGVESYEHEIMANRLPMLSQIDQFKIDLTVHGRTDMEVGKVIHITMPEFKDSNRSELDMSDPFLTGRYLVTAIHHVFSPAKHMMVMQCIKDSIAKQFGSDV